MGFLTKFQTSKFYPLFQRLLRTLQFLSALSSLVVFSIRIRKLLKLYNSISRSEGAVEGIVAAATLYTLLVLLLNVVLKNGGSKILRWVLVALDIAFVGAFIAVSVLTSPKNGKAGPCYGQRRREAESNGFVNGDNACKLPLGTFVTAIISTILHALTAIFQNVRQHHREHRDNIAVKEEHGYNGVGRDSTNPMVRDAHHNGVNSGVGHNGVNNGVGHNGNLNTTAGHHNDGRVHNNTSAV